MRKISIFLILAAILNHQCLHAQGFFDKLKKKAQQAIDKTTGSIEKKIDKAADKAVDSLLSGKSPIALKNNKPDNSNNSTTSSEVSKESNEKTQIVTSLQTDDKLRPVNSEIKNTDFVQYKPTASSNLNTRYRIAGNLYIDIKGKYPQGYLPKWRFISYYSSLKLAKEDYINPKPSIQYEPKNMWIGDYKGKAVIRYQPHFNCQCYADIITKDSLNVISEMPQTYEIGNFTTILNDRATGEPCVGGLTSNIWQTAGKGGKVTLSANDNGDIKMSFMLEYYTAPRQNVYITNKTTRKRELKEFVPPAVSYRFTANDIIIDNEMSAERANEIVRKELEEKNRRKEYLENCKKQISELMKLIEQKYPQRDCRECYIRERSSGLKVTPSKTFYTDGYGNVYSESSTNWDINSKLYIKNKCNYKITFIGIKQLYDEGKGYYFTDVTATVDANYEYFVEQGMFSLLLTSMVGNNSDINLQKEYDISSARVGAIQWIKVIRK